MKVKGSGRFWVRSGNGVPPMYFTGLERASVPDTQEFPDIGTLTHLNVAECGEGGSIQVAVSASLEKLPAGASSVVLVGETNNPENNTRVAVFYREPD